MAFFEPIEGGIILLKQAGLYREASAFVYDEQIYAQHGQGHIRLHPSGQTTAKIQHRDGKNPDSRTFTYKVPPNMKLAKDDKVVE